MSTVELLASKVAQIVNSKYNAEITFSDVQIQKTLPEFKGDLTVVVFPFLKYSKMNPIKTGEDIGRSLTSELDEVESFNVIKGFLNLSLQNDNWGKILNTIAANEKLGQIKKENPKQLIVEYSSPNTNKPLHLGHARNNFLGYSVAQILKANGENVIKTQIINDRGIHICKSMVAWKLYSDNKTPDSEGIKGDKFVGDYYVKFEVENQRQINDLIEKGHSKEEASKNTELMKEAVNLLKLWEDQDPDTIDLWKKMNGWVYDGFDSTHQSINIKSVSYTHLTLPTILLV